MKTLSVLAMAAMLTASSAFAQETTASQGAAAEGVTKSDSSSVRQSSEARRHAEERRTEAKRREEARGRRAFASARAAATAFDGEWSVLIETRVGDCTPSFRYGVAIQNGEVLNAGGEQVSLAGHVAPNGAVRVNVAAGNQEAYGAGRLSRTTGSGGGTWRGSGSAGACSGVWEAERRG